MFRNNDLFKKAQEALKARNGGAAIASTEPSDYPLAQAELNFPITVKMSVKIVKILNVDTSSNTDVQVGRPDVPACCRGSNFEGVCGLGSSFCSGI